MHKVFRFTIVPLLLLLAGCGSSASSTVYHAPDHTFSLTEPDGWQEKTQQFAGSSAPDFQFYAGGANPLLSVRSEANPTRLSPGDYILRRIMHYKQYSSRMRPALLQSVGTHAITVQHVRGLSYTTFAGDAIQTVVLSAHGRIYLIFGFASDGIKQLAGILKNFQFA